VDQDFSLNGCNLLSICFVEKLLTNAYVGMALAMPRPPPLVYGQYQEVRSVRYKHSSGN